MTQQEYNNRMFACFGQGTPFNVMYKKAKDAVDKGEQTTVTPNDVVKKAFEFVIYNMIRN